MPSWRSLLPGRASRSRRPAFRAGADAPPTALPRLRGTVGWGSSTACFRGAEALTWKPSFGAVRPPFEALRPHPALRGSRERVGRRQGPASRLCGAEAVARHAVAMQVGAADVEPGLGALHV